MQTAKRSLALLTLTALGAAPACAQTEPPSFEEFFKRVTECTLDLPRYGSVIQPTRDGVLIALPSAGAVRGFLIDSFYVSSGRDGAPEYGLLFNAPLDAVGKAFPELLGRHTVNGYLRRLSSLAEQSRARNAARKTLLICTAGMPV